MNKAFQIFIVGLSLMVIVLAGCQQGTEQSNEGGTESVTGMLQHNVYFYLNEDVTAEEREQFEEGLKKLLSIEEIYRYQLGTPGSTEERDVTDHSFGYSIFSWFKTLEDYRVYADHPTHLEFIDEYKHLWADVKVYDSEVIDSN